MRIMQCFSEEHSGAMPDRKRAKKMITASLVASEPAKSSISSNKLKQKILGVRN